MIASKYRFPKILIIGSNARGSLENAYLRALHKVGVHQVDFFDVDRHKYFSHGSKIVVRGINRLVSPVSMWRVSKKFLQFLSNKKKRKYDVVIIFKGMEFSRKLLETCRLVQPGAVWFNIYTDDPFNIESQGSTNSNIIDSLSFFDVYCIWSHNLIYKLKERGCRRVEYLPFGYDSDSHGPPPYTVAIEPSAVSFVGAWDPHREEILTALANYDLRIYGYGWDRVPRRSPLRKNFLPRNIYGDELSKAIYSSAVSLNLLRPQNFGAHNMRTFEIPAMSGLMLTTRSKEQNDFFPEGEGSLMYSDVHELRNQLDRLFSDTELAQRLRHRGNELSKGHSYSDRAKYLVRIINDTKQSKI